MNEIILFEQKQVRRVLLYDEWWFVISDIVAVLTDSVNPKDYLKKLRKRDQSLSDAFKGGGQIVPPLGIEFDTPGGRQMMQCWNTIGILRLIQSIPSPKAEFLKVHKRYAELGSYIGTNCPHVVIENKLKVNWIKALLQNKIIYIMPKKLKI